MAKITIAELDLNTVALLKKAEETKIAISKLTLEQQKLKAASKENTTEFIKNEVELKKNRAALLNQKKAIIALESPYKKLSRELNIARMKAKDLAAEFGINSEQAKKAALNVNKLDSRLKDIDKSVGQSQRNVGNYNSGLKTMALRFVGLTAVIALAGRAFRDMVNRVRFFDKEMTGLAAILGTTRKEVKDLETAIIDVAGSSIKTSTQVAELATTLITLGKTKSEVIELLKPVNDLAIAMEATSAEAGELLVQTLNAFGKGTESATEYADIISKMRTSTALDFQRIKEALGFLAPTSRAAGVSFEETGALLGVLVDNGIKASRAGRLTSTSFLKLAADGLTLEDALDEINQAQEKGLSSTQLLTTASKLFGKESAAIGLILANNRGKVEELTTSFENSGGSLEKLTEGQLKSLDAQVKILDSTWEKLILNIENGEGVISSFVKGTITATTGFLNLVDDISTTSDGFLDFIVTFGKSMSIQGQSQIRIDAIVKKAGQAAKESKEELIRLTLEQSKVDKEYQTQIEFRVRAINKMSGDEIKSALKVIESKKLLAKKALEDADKDSELLKAKNLKLTEDEIKELAIFNKKKIKLEEEFNLIQESNTIERQRIKLNNKLASDKRSIDNLKISESQKNELILELEKAHQQEVDNLDKTVEENKLKNINSFEERKKQLLDEIKLSNAANEEQEAILKAERDFEKQEAEIEKMNLTSEQKKELLALLITNEEQVKADIRQQFLDQELEMLNESNVKIIKSEEKQAAGRLRLARSLTRSLTKVLGDSLGARLASIAIQAGVEAGVVKMQAASASGQVASNTAIAVSKSIAASPLTGGLPFSAAAIAAGGLQQASIAASSTSAISTILGSAALKGLGSLASFDKGGVVGLGSGKITNDSNIPTQSGGDNLLATVKRGEVILNNEQQERAGGAAFFSSIGVPGFATGGVFGVNSTVTAPIQQAGANIDNIANRIVEGINNIKVVTVVDDVTNAQAIQTQIVSGADI